MKRIMIAIVVLFSASGARADGAATYAQKCAMCHGKDANGGGMYKKSIKGRPEAEVLNVIKEGKGKMKPVAIDDAADVAKYVAALK
jgi:cytochrome c6